MSKLVTYEAVASAAEALVVDGKRASVRSVMSMLGGGSPNSVLVHLNNWKAGRPIVQVATVEVDPRIAQIVAEQINKATSDARSEIEMRLSEVEADAAAIAEAGRQAEIDLEQAQQHVASLLAQVQQQAGTVEQLKVDADAVKLDAAKQVADERQRARDSIAKAEEVAARERNDRELAQMELAKASLRLEGLPKLEAEILRLQSALDAERVARSGAEAKAVGAEAKASGLADRLADAQTQAAQSAVVARERLADAQAVAVEQQRSCNELTAALRSEVKNWQEKLREAVEAAQKPAETL